jgi:hypothetical protein
MRLPLSSEPIPQMYCAGVANDEKVSAFVTYNDSLRSGSPCATDVLVLIA